MKLLKVEDVIKTIDYIKKQTGYEGDIFLNVNVNAIPIEWIENYISKMKDDGMIYLSSAGSIKDMIKEWEKENADL
jgi:hypothetical protein